MDRVCLHCQATTPEKESWVEWKLDPDSADVVYFCGWACKKKFYKKEYGVTSIRRKPFRGGNLDTASLRDLYDLEFLTDDDIANIAASDEPLNKARKALRKSIVELINLTEKALSSTDLVRSELLMVKDIATALGVFSEESKKT